MKCKTCGTQCRMKFKKGYKMAFDCCGNYYCEDCWSENRHICHQIDKIKEIENEKGRN